MDQEARERVEKRLKALGIESSPEKQRLRQVYSKAVSNISKSEEALEKLEGEEHGSLKYAVSSIDMDLKIISQEKGQDNYQNLLRHVEELGEVKKHVMDVEKMCANAVAFLEWVNERREKYDLDIDDLGSYHKEANKLGSESERLLEEIQSIIEERIEIVERLHQNIESDQQRAWQGSSKGLEYAFKELQAIQKADFD